AAIEAANDTRGEFELCGESRFDARGVFFGAAFRECFAEDFAGADGIEEAFAGERIDPGSGITDHGPILADHSSLAQRAFFGRRKNVAVELGAFGRDVIVGDKYV